MRPTRCWATAGPRSPRCCREGERLRGFGDRGDRQGESQVGESPVAEDSSRLLGSCSRHPEAPESFRLVFFWRVNLPPAWEVKAGIWTSKPLLCFHPAPPWAWSLPALSLLGLQGALGRLGSILARIFLQINSQSPKWLIAPPRVLQFLEA